MATKKKLVPGQPFYEASNARLMLFGRIALIGFLVFAALAIVLDKMLGLSISLLYYIIEFGLLAASVVLFIVAAQLMQVAVNRVIQRDLGVKLRGAEAQGILLILSRYQPAPAEQPLFEIDNLPGKKFEFVSQDGSTHVQLVEDSLGEK